MNPARCDIIVPVWNRLESTKGCLNSIYANTPGDFNVIVIDNASDSETKDFLRNFKSSRDNMFLIENKDNLGWIKAINQGIRLSLSPFICLMNNDTVVRMNGWLSEMIRIAEAEFDIGLVNPRFEIKKWQTAKSHYTEMDFCRGHCLLIKRAVIDKIGLFDEAFGMGYNDDDDFSIRAIRAGFRCIMANNVTVEHIRGSTFLTLFSQGKINEFQKENERLLIAKWGKRLRLVFIIAHARDVNKISDLLYTLARRQHKIYVWNLSKPLMLEHTNIRERLFPFFCPPFIFSLMLYLNKKKKISKHYNLIFSDNKKFCLASGDKRSQVQLFDGEKDLKYIVRLVDSVSLER